jgi:hypothetical protein
MSTGWNSTAAIMVQASDRAISCNMSGYVGVNLECGTRSAPQLRKSRASNGLP